MFKNYKFAAIVAATTLAPLASGAATLDGNYDVTALVSDRNGVTLSLWLEEIVGPGLSTLFEIDTPGTFAADAAGGVLDASTVSSTGAAAGFDISMTFDRDFSDLAYFQDPLVTATVPDFKDVFGNATRPPAVEHGNEDYLDLEFGTLTGTGGLTGLTFDIVRAPVDGQYGTQFGGGITSDIGANQHNSNFGVSGWFLIAGYTLDPNGCLFCVTDTSFYDNLIGTQGDINMELSPAPVPLPAAGLMLLSGLVGFGAFAGRRRKS
jgi:hypothetical protein